MYLGKRVGGWLWLALLGGATGTGVAAEPKRAEVGAELVLPLGSLPERVCWYQDQKYSLGPGSSRATAGWSAPRKTSWRATGHWPGASRKGRRMQWQGDEERYHQRRSVRLFLIQLKTWT